jgi:hypothetical protein
MPSVDIDHIFDIRCPYPYAAYLYYITIIYIFHRSWCIKPSILILNGTSPQFDTTFIDY